MPVIELRAGAQIAAVSPETGGSLTRFATETGPAPREWLRPAAPEAVETRSAGGTSCFPMVPFSNRIRNARFHFRGRLIQLAPNFSPEPHAIHGHGWRARWEVVDQAEDHAEVELTHAAGDWPWTYRARQVFTLSADALRVSMRVTNESRDPMPVGFGLHPYFVRTPRTRLWATVGRMWQADADLMPVELVPPPVDLSLDGPGLNPDATPLDNNFLGFAGRAVIEWPEWRARLRLTADPIFSCLVVYTPPGQDFFCAEPATNCIDAFNLADMGRTDTGLQVLEPGATIEGAVTLEPEMT